MNVLRWFLLVSTVFVTGGYGFFLVVAGGFRRSFGAASPASAWELVPLIAGALLLASLLLPHVRALLHLAAAAAGALLAVCLWFIVRESAVVLVGAVVHLGLWLVFYALVLQRGGEAWAEKVSEALP